MVEIIYQLCTEYVLRWKSNGVCKSKDKLLYTAFLHSIKISENRIEIKFDKDPLAVEQKNLLEKNCKFLYCLLIRCLAKKSY